jgi:hypothetical protein
MTLSTTRERSEQGDAITVILCGAAAVIVVLIANVLDFLDTFRPDGVAARVPLESGSGEGVLENTSARVSGSLSELTVVVTDLNAVSTFCLGAAIVVAALAQLVVIAAVMHLAWSFLRGRFFVRAAARDFGIISWAMFLGALGVLLLQHMGTNGVLAALGTDGREPVHPIAFWSFAPYWFAATAVGLLSVAFRRGAQLQRDTEGLV